MPKYRTLITTQYLENYGAHSENGKFADGNAYWKFKPSQQYVISTNSHKEANAVAFLSAYLHKDQDERSKEIVTAWEPLAADCVEEDLIDENNPFDRGPIYIDIEEYFEYKKDIKKKREAGGKISVDKSRGGTVLVGGFTAGGLH